jgi:hypothetical protein
MAFEKPTGVGVNNFGFNLLGQGIDRSLHLNLDEIALTPHNEALRIWAEEGIGVFIIYAGFLLFLVFFSIKNIFFDKNSDTLFFRFLLCFLPEIFLQFPSELYFPTFMFAIYSVISLSKDALPAVKNKFLVLTCLIGLSLFTTFSWIVRNEKLISTSSAPGFCSFYHDDWRMCRLYFADLYLSHQYEKANDVARPIIKYQPFNYIFLNLDYSLGQEPKSSVEACLYFNLFDRLSKIKDSDLKDCRPIKDRTVLKEMFYEFAEKR